jgi:hypothetical protein
MNIRFWKFTNLPISQFTLSPAWLALLLALPAILPLAAPGYFFNAHDAHHSVFFLVEFDQAIRDGALWPVWGPDHAVGFGYPLWLLYAPLAYYVAEAFHLLGLGFTAAVKATWALCFILGALGMYRLARRWWGPGAGLVASVAYTYTPYHLAQIYVRAALAEFAALAWFPWVWLAFAGLWDEPGPRRTAGAALAFGALLLTHTVSTLIFVPLLGGFLLLQLISSERKEGRGEHVSPFPRREGGQGVRSEPPFSKNLPLRGRGVRVRWTGLALALGGLLVTIFLLPMLLERRYIVEAQWVQETYAYSKHFVYLNQFFDPTWGFGYSVAGPNDGMSFQLGLLQLLGAAVGVVVALADGGWRMADGGWRMANGEWQMADGEWRMANGNRHSAIGIPHSAIPFLAIVSLLTLFAMTPAARPLWDVLPLVSLIQFPWRLLALTTVTLALLCAAGMSWLATSLESRSSASAGSPYACVLVLAMVLAGFPYTRPELVPVRPQDESPLAIIEFETKHPDMRGMTRWSQRPPADADSPLLAQYLDGRPLVKAAIVAGQGVILAQGHAAASAYAHVRAESEVRLRFYTYYFPGWQASVNGRLAEIAPDPPNGLIGLTLPPGEHDVRLRFGPTPVRRLATGISLVALVGLVWLWLAGRRPRRPT